MKKIYLLIIYLFLSSLALSAQEPEPQEILFESCTIIKTMSITRFNKLTLRHSEVAKLQQEHKLPHCFISRQDSANDTAAEVVYMVYKKNKGHMIAFREGKKVILFEFLNSQVYLNYKNIKIDKDISGDGINEVFIYFEKSFSHSGSYSDSWGGSRTLIVLNPAARLKILEEEIGSSGTGWNMCTGKTSSYSRWKEFTFFTGGFYTTSHFQRQVEGEEGFESVIKGSTYLYTPKGFITKQEVK